MEHSSRVKDYSPEEPLEMVGWARIARTVSISLVKGSDFCLHGYRW